MQEKHITQTRKILTPYQRVFLLFSTTVLLFLSSRVYSPSYLWAIIAFVNMLLALYFGRPKYTENIFQTLIGQMGAFVFLFEPAFLMFAYYAYFLFDRWGLSGNHALMALYALLLIMLLIATTKANDSFLTAGLRLGVYLFNGGYLVTDILGISILHHDVDLIGCLAAFISIDTAISIAQKDISSKLQ